MKGVPASTTDFGSKGSAMRRALRWLVRYGVLRPWPDPGWWPAARSLLAFLGLLGLGVVVAGIAGLIHAAVKILAGEP